MLALFLTDYTIQGYKDITKKYSYSKWNDTMFYDFRLL